MDVQRQGCGAQQLQTSAYPDPSPTKTLTAHPPAVPTGVCPRMFGHKSHTKILGHTSVGTSAGTSAGTSVGTLPWAHFLGHTCVGTLPWARFCRGSFQEYSFLACLRRHALACTVLQAHPHESTTGTSSWVQFREQISLGALS